MPKDNPGWWSRNVNRVARPEQQTPEQAKRAPWVLIAFFAVLVVLAVGTWALRVFVFEPSQSAEQPPAPTTSTEASAEPSTPPQDGTCQLDTTDRDISTSPPEATRWVVERWAALPEIDSAGPCIEEDGYRVGFAHTQTGAVLATYHYFVHANPSTANEATRGIAEYALVDGPLKESILQRIDDVLNGVEPRNTDAEMAQITLRGYRITYEGDTAVVELLAGSTDGSVLSGGTFKLIWLDGDWRVDPASGESLEASTTNVRPGDFVLWSASTAGTP
ncbi:MAG: hypothetical protein ACTH8F_07590 [Microbacterium sp.]|uniref:hypothetical protein n=1 Tax=Microbacterium sp. TaxID=51671 RepID=UPI003F9C4030